METKMTINVIKKLTVSVAILLGTSAAYSMQMQHDPLSEMLPSSRVSIGGNAGVDHKAWCVQLTEEGSTGSFGGIKIKIGNCGTVNVCGEGTCINYRDRKDAVQLFELIKIMRGVNHRYSCGFVSELIEQLEKCPCPEVKPAGKPAVVPVVCHEK